MDGAALLHYSDRRVLEELARFSAGRWLALEAKPRRGRRIFVRWLGSTPLRASDPLGIAGLLHRFRGLGVRTIYGSLAVYHKLSKKEDVENPSNVAAVTPFWDIDSSLERWREALEAARVIVDFLESWGVRRSVYLVWSGEGVHVRVHERAFKESLERAHPVDVAFSVVEYTLRKLAPRLKEVASRAPGVLKVENLVDFKRVFTAPLSLHRERDLVAVPFKPDDLDSFDPFEWCRPGSYKFNPSWAEYVEGEADSLALEAVKHVPPSRSPGSPKLRATRVEAEKLAEERGPQPPESCGGVGRFQVMALLQAARYFVLYGDEARAKSFGLNRAIFYAWAKHYGPAKRPWRARSKPRPELVEVAGEKVQVGSEGYFVMGGVEQRPEDFDRQVAARFEAAGVRFEEAWKAAVEYVSRFPRSVLRDPQKFYEVVYEPVRDRFLEKVLRRGSGFSLDKFLGR